MFFLTVCVFQPMFNIMLNCEISHDGQCSALCRLMDEDAYGGDNCLEAVATSSPTTGQCIGHTLEPSLLPRALGQTDWSALLYHQLLRPDTRTRRCLARQTVSKWLPQSYQGGLLQYRYSGSMFWSTSSKLFVD